MATEIQLPLDQMTVAEKLAVIDTVWNDLLKSKADIPVPEWHKRILDERRQAYLRGESGYTDWDVAKEEIRKRVS